MMKYEKADNRMSSFRGINRECYFIVQFKWIKVSEECQALLTICAENVHISFLEAYVYAVLMCSGTI